MSRPVTLAQLRADIAQQADVAGSTARHVPSLLNRLINTSIGRFRERLSTEGSTIYLSSAYGTLTAGVASLYPFGLLDLTSAPTMLVKAYGVDVTIGTEVRPLTPVPFEERASYGAAPGEPRAWTQWGRTHLAILPAPQAAYPYTLWYLQHLAPLVSDSDAWDGVAGWEEYVTWDVVCRVLVRDQTGKAYEMCVQARNEVWHDVLRSARSAKGPGGTSVTRDVFGERLHGCSRRRTLPDP